MARVDRVLLAAPRSFCAGVEMAIKALAWMVRVYGRPVYCYHEIVHNRRVVERFEKAGVVFVDTIDDIPPAMPIMLSAHGAAPSVAEAARRRSPAVVDAVCPLVKKVHHEVKRRAEAGYSIVYIGHPGHDEAVGTMAVAPEAMHLVQGPSEIPGSGDLEGPVAFLAQTTLAEDDWAATLAATRQELGDVWLPHRSDLCFATTNRQAAVKTIAPTCDAMVVVGSANSSNTQALVQVAELAGCPRVIRINGSDELPLDLAGTVGVTAGASAPESLTQDVVSALAPARDVQAVEVTSETEYFPPPQDLRALLGAAGVAQLLDDDRSASADGALHAAEVDQAEPLQARLTAYSLRIDHHIEGLIDQEIQDRWLRQAIGYHLGWPNEGFAVVPAEAKAAGGKKLRGSLALLSHALGASVRAQRDRAQAPGYVIDEALWLAAAVELLHNWSLIHDDIQDGDHHRRGRPALWTVCGIPQAINVGNSLHGLASRCLARLSDTDVPEGTVTALLAELAQASVLLTTGQVRDLAAEADPELTLDGYRAMVRGKTCAVIGYCAASGGLLGSGDPQVAEHLARYGQNLGLAFQARDDILGIWGDQRETGKPAGADLQRRKKSLPVVLALHHATGDDRCDLLRFYDAERPVEPDDQQAIHKILDRCGARALAQAEADQHRQEALEALSELKSYLSHDPSAPAEDHLAALADIANFATRRSR